MLLPGSDTDYNTWTSLLSPFADPLTAVAHDSDGHAPSASSASSILPLPVCVYYALSLLLSALEGQRMIMVMT